MAYVSSGNIKVSLITLGWGCIPQALSIWILMDTANGALIMPAAALPVAIDKADIIVKTNIIIQLYSYVYKPFSIATNDGVLCQK